MIVSAVVYSVDKKVVNVDCENWNFDIPLRQFKKKDRPKLAYGVVIVIEGKGKLRVPKIPVWTRDMLDKAEAWAAELSKVMGENA